MKLYDKIYRKNINVWGNEADALVKKGLKYLRPKGQGLDLGCGQGKDSIFLAKHGLGIVAIDSSEIAIKQLKKNIRANKLGGIKVIEEDINKYPIPENKFDFIISINALHFLSRKDIFILLRKIKKGLKKDGIVILSSFTNKDSAYRRKGVKIKYFFKAGEISRFFKKFKIISYSEKTINDRGHTGNPKPHRHGVVEIICTR